MYGFAKAFGTVLAASFSFAADFTGQVVSDLDGDTLEVLHTGHPERIRVNGIDCPEKGQAFGQRAKQSASGLVYGKDVRLLTHGLDKYGRTLYCFPHCHSQTHISTTTYTAFHYAPSDTAAP